MNKKLKKRDFRWASDGARERSAAAGAANLAAYRATLDGELKQSHTTHGVVTFLAKGGAPTEIAAKLDAFEAGLLSDLGSEPTAAQRALIDSTRVSLGVCFLANAYLSQDGLSKLKKNRWLLSTLATFINSTRLNLQALGLERRAKQVETLDSVFADIAANRAGKPEAKPVEKVPEELESQ